MITRPIIESLMFRGRLGRVGYWRWFLALIALSGLVMVLILLASSVGLPRWALFVVGAPLLLLVIVNLGVVVRRLHDRGKGAIWLLIFLALPILLSGAASWLMSRPDAATSANPALLASALMLATLGVNLWAWVELGFLRGAAIDNRFGPPVG